MLIKVLINNFISPAFAKCLDIWNKILLLAIQFIYNLKHNIIITGRIICGCFVPPLIVTQESTGQKAKHFTKFNCTNKCQLRHKVNTL